MKHVQCYKTKRNRSLKTILNLNKKTGRLLYKITRLYHLYLFFFVKVVLNKNVLYFTNSHTCQIMQSTFTHNNQLVLLTFTINPDIWTILETVWYIYIYAKHNYHVCAQVRNANVIIIYVQFQFKSLRRCITPALHYCS